MRVLLQVRPSGCRMVRRASEQECPWVRVAWEALVAWWARVARQQSVAAVRRRARQPLVSVQAERRRETVVWARHEARYPWVWGAWVAWPVPREHRVALAWRGRPKERREHRPWEERAWWGEHRPRWEGAWAEDCSWPLRVGWRRRGGRHDGAGGHCGLFLFLARSWWVIQLLAGRLEPLAAGALNNYLLAKGCQIFHSNRGIFVANFDLELAPGRQPVHSSPLFFKSYGKDSMDRARKAQA